MLEQIKDLKNNRDKQLENKDKQLLQMQNLLDQQQRLSLQDKKLLEEYKAENDSLKALKMPTEDTKEEQANRSTASGIRHA
ncbi:Replication-associated protein [Lactococcus cremoris]|nr:Replication-associated protein [Lactococcus cremoris]